MAKYKIKSTYLQFPIILETEANDKAFEMFVAYCDYQGIDEDDIECEYDNNCIVYAKAQPESEYDEEGAEFTFELMK